MKLTMIVRVANILKERAATHCKLKALFRGHIKIPASKRKGTHELKV